MPAYDPSVAYGSWPYPANPPVYYPPPVGAYVGSALLSGLAFGAGVAVTGALWGWGRPNWGNGSVNVNVNRFNSINANRVNNRAITSNTWQHNVDHRRGVGYANASVRQQYRPNAASNAQAREAFPGRTPSGAPQLGQQRQAAAGRLQGGAGGAQGRLSSAQRPGVAGHPNAPARAQNFQRPNRAGGSPAFSGVGNGAATRAHSAQGRASRGGMAQARGYGGGGARAGGARAGGARAHGGGGGGHRGGRR